MDCLCVVKLDGPNVTCQTLQAYFSPAEGSYSTLIKTITFFLSGHLCFQVILCSLSRLCLGQLISARPSALARPWPVLKSWSGLRVSSHLISSQNLLSCLMFRIIGNIYLGSLEALDPQTLATNKITHILSLLPGPLPEITSSYTHLQVPITDDSSTNLLHSFPPCFKFINTCLFKDPCQFNGRKQSHQGAILIHCHEGLSRSVAVLIGYLMKCYDLSLTQATHAIARKQQISINPTFEAQLEVYEKCKADLAANEDPYKEYLFEFYKDQDPKWVLDQFNSDILAHTFGPKDKGVESDTGAESKESGVLRCKKCRETLGIGAQILNHSKPTESSHQSVFYKKAGNYIYASEKASVDCSHYFLRNPLNWMNLGKGEDLEGRLDCIKCNSKIGGYSWKGSRCSCGKWIIPSFHLLTSKVDYMKS